MESPISSEMNEEESDKDMDFIDEYDSEEEKRLKKKRKVFLTKIRQMFLTICLDYYTHSYHYSTSENHSRSRKGKALCMYCL